MLIRGKGVDEGGHALDKRINPAYQTDQPLADLGKPLWIGFVQRKAKLLDRLLRHLHACGDAYQRLAQALAHLLELPNERHHRAGKSVEDRAEYRRKLGLRFLCTQVHRADADFFDAVRSNRRVDRVQVHPQRLGSASHGVGHAGQHQLELDGYIVAQLLCAVEVAAAAKPTAAAVNRRVRLNHDVVNHGIQRAADDADALIAQRFLAAEDVAEVDAEKRAARIKRPHVDATRAACQQATRAAQTGFQRLHRVEHRAVYADKLLGRTGRDFDRAGDGFALGRGVAKDCAGALIGLAHLCAIGSRATTAKTPADFKTD